MKLHLYVAGLLLQSCAALATGPSRTLQPWKFSPLPAGSVKPAGWLLGEMRAMAEGLAGHEHDFYVYVNQSSWLNVPGGGGTEYSNLNEALPYWFNSLVPMAYQLDHGRLKAQVHQVAGTVLGHQAADGWIGPEVGAARNFWARTPFLLGLVQLVEANNTWQDPVVKSLRSFMSLSNAMLKDDGRGFTKCDKDVDCRWGQARIHDLIITIQWLLEHHPSDQDSLLWENMDLFYAQNQYKWDKWYTEGTFEEVVDVNDDSIFPYIHGVNVGQGLKASAVIYRINGSSAMVQKSLDAIEWTFRHHGSASGSVLADEKERDVGPFMGSELCTAVETGYSLAYTFQVHGRGEHADGAERTMFNAFPVMMTGDGWAHQYMAQPNQPFALNTTASDGHVPPLFTTANSGLSTTFGMEPQYPCCTVNHPQGYPKFVANSWAAVGRRGLAHVLLGPSTVMATVDGASVSVECNTAYPFGDRLSYTIKTDKQFDFYLRVPEWSRSFKVSRGLARVPKRDASTGMFKMQVEPGQTKIVCTISTEMRTEARANDTVAVLYGNLLYALDVGFSQTSSFPHAYYDTKGPGLSNLPFPQLRDYYINSTKPWNVAIDPSTLEYHGLDGASLPNPVFEHGAAPNYMTVDGCEIAWGLRLGVTPDWAPLDRTCIGDRKSFRLIPYGAAKVHMSDLPVVRF
ncbi:hypothetical protein G6O67_004991 [Ophiocordyceps sinensis]|uniref:Non-reducing end beta-L-arabinofuranosidase-like GH127 middle domain-containing protein n=1 Tax=Ophiocordyceps sinensis TaxID=72228 RepID=A0A8H4V5P6_9HYPO|nr:hypothetical protein G6O67_004991 [Ophiocordyceps sinensis]